jgi:hypothetical protein
VISSIRELGRSLAARPEIAGVVALLIAHCLRWNYTVDDAYISFRFAENLLGGRGLVYNPGERVEGYTNFLWVLLVAVPMELHISPVVATKIFGLAASSALLVLVALDLGKERGRVIGFGAALLLALDPAFSLWTTAGLETPLFLLFAYLTLRPLLVGDGALRARSGVYAGLAALTRPEGYLLFAAALVASLVARAKQPPWRAALLFAALVVPHLVFKQVYYGALLPNTYEAKVGGVLAWDRGARYMTDWLFRYGAWPVALAAAAGIVSVFLRSAEERAARRARSLLIVAALFAIYVVAVGGDGLPMFRFALFLLLPLAILAADGVAPLLRFAPGLAPAALFVALSLFPLRNSFAGPYHAFAVDDRERVRLHWVEIGKWLARHTLPDDVVAVGVAGAIPFYGKIAAIDMLGITDAHIARAPAAIGSGIAGHERGDMSYVLAKEPDFILHYPFLVPSPETPLTESQFRTEWNPGLEEILTRADVRDAFNKAYRSEVAEVRTTNDRVAYLRFFRKRAEVRGSRAAPAVDRATPPVARTAPPAR